MISKVTLEFKNVLSTLEEICKHKTWVVFGRNLQSFIYPNNFFVTNISYKLFD